MPNTVRPARAPRAAAAAALLAVTAAACAPAGGGTAAPSPVVHQTTTRVESGTGMTYDVTTTADDRSVDATFPTTPDKIWAVLPLVYDSLGVKLTTLNPGGRTLGAQNALHRRRLGGQPLSRAVSCGAGITGADNADSYDVYLTVMSAVEARGTEQAVVRTWVQGNARPTGNAGNLVRCASTGWLERQIADRVARRLGSGGGAR